MYEAALRSPQANEWKESSYASGVAGTGREPTRSIPLKGQEEEAMQREREGGGGGTTDPMYRFLPSYILPAPPRKKKKTRHFSDWRGTETCPAHRVI